MTDSNKYGLSREIGGPIKREIRQRCGFGCIMCGSAIYQYEHVDPPFSEAKMHDPNCIVLLCGSCHDRVTRGLLSKDTIKIKSVNPKCKEQGFSFGPFDIGTNAPEVVIGTFKGTNVETLIRINGDEIFTVLPPSSPGLPFLINARLCDRDGDEILRINDNEWQTPSTNWDVEVIGARITIRKKLGDILLVIRSEPPNRLVVERMDMMHKGLRIRCKEGNNLEITNLSDQVLLRTSEMSVIDCKFGIDVNLTESLIPSGPTHNSFNLSKGLRKIGRNMECPCGSGVKYKKCCGSNK